MSQQPKILIGCPTCNLYEYCLDEYLDRARNLSYSNYDLLIVDNSKDENYHKKIKEAIKDEYVEPAIKRIVSSRNKLRKYALENNYDYFLSLEQDVIPPKDIIERMLRHAKHVVSGIYFLDEKLTAKAFPLTKEQLWDDPGLYEIGSAGLGCVLIHRSILESIEFRSENKEFDDRFFYKDCKEKEIPIFCDTSIKCKHLTKEMHWETIEK